jgi:hypothetical protein
MTLWDLALRSLRHYRWLNLGVLAGVSLTSAIISGSLAVGDSVRASLAANAATRLGKVAWAITGGDRFFTAPLAAKLDPDAAALLQTTGTVSTPDGSVRVNGVQVVGVDESFWKLSEVPPAPLLSGELAINQPLARRLGLGPGERIVLSVEPPGAISRDAPLSGSSNQPEKLRRKISRVILAPGLGNFRLNAEQVPPLTVFMPLPDLQTALAKNGEANVILSPGGSIPSPEALLAAATLADAQLRLIQGAPRTQLQTTRVFLPESLAERIHRTFPGADGSLTYLVNAVRAGDRLTPYSMAAAILDDTLPEGQAICSDWLAEDLGIKVGDPFTIDFFRMSGGRQLVEETRTLTVARIAPLSGGPFHASLSPDFPGISDAEDNADWDPGMPFHKERIRPKDEAYWDAHRTLPKLILPLTTGQKLWGNRFGSLTSITLPPDAAGLDEAAVWGRLRRNLTPGDLGWQIRDLRAEARGAVARSYDFGGLFAGMSFFLIIAALILAMLVFVFGIEQRRGQIGLLLAVGLGAGRIRRLFLFEATVLALAGATLGLWLGFLYTQAALWGLGGAWRDAAAGVQFIHSVTPGSLAIAWTSTLLLSLGTVFWATRNATHGVKPNELISGAVGWLPSALAPWPKRPTVWLTVGSALGGLLLLLVPQSGTVMARQGAFFGAGFLLLLAGILGMHLLLQSWERRAEPLRSLGALARSNSLRRHGRSLSVIALTASGVFMITAINSLRLNGEQQAGKRASGTGGFAFVAQSSLPVYENLNSAAGRSVFGLPENPSPFDLVQFRVNQGEDASCLNLNRASQPRLLGVDPAALADRGAFAFAARAFPKDPTGWTCLSQPPVTDSAGIPEIQGILDAATAQYALGIGLGSRLDLTAANGKPFRVRVAGLLDNSVLQGSVVIDERQFTNLFPDAGGYRFFLLDARPEVDASAAAALWTRQLEDRGFELQPTWKRLNEFNGVQNTYLGIFSTLGGLGLLLGTAGLGIVTGRNILERRGQLALLNAVGFSKARLARLVVWEHWFLHGAGVLLGIAAGLAAILPTLMARSGSLPVTLLLCLNALILFGGLGFCWIAARLMLRENLNESLRHE